MALSYCGVCGKHWEQATKSNQTGANKTKSKRADTDTEVTSFAMPSLGYSLSGSSVAPGSSQQPVQPPQQAATKPLRVLLHQKANRIGKIEARLEKLQQALQEVQQSWPVYVNKVKQHLNQEYQKCVEYQTKAAEEVKSLQQELKELMSTQIMPSPVPPHAMPQVDYAAAHGTSTAHSSQVQQALEVLASAGIVIPSMHPVGPKPMEEDTHVEAYVQKMGDSGFPSHPASMQQVNVPVQEPHVLPNHAFDQNPPGHWTWPPLPPVLPNLTLDEPDLAPQEIPAVEPTGHTLPVLPLTTPPAVSEVPPGIAPEVATAVIQATAGLQEWCVQQGIGDGQTLPQEYQEQLLRFAIQQQECSQKMRAFQEQAQAMPEPPTGKPVVYGPAPFSHQSKPPILSHPYTGVDGMSINSSPARTPQRAEEYSIASPPGQRDLKVAKTNTGDVHLQGTFGVAVQQPVPSSPPSPDTPTPVPTEIATPGNSPIHASQDVQGLD